MPSTWDSCPYFGISLALEEQVRSSDTMPQANGLFFEEDGRSIDKYEIAARAVKMSTRNLFTSGEISGSSGDHAAACM